MAFGNRFFQNNQGILRRNLLSILLISTNFIRDSSVTRDLRKTGFSRLVLSSPFKTIKAFCLREACYLFFYKHQLYIGSFKAVKEFCLGEANLFSYKQQLYDKLINNLWFKENRLSVIGSFKAIKEFYLRGINSFSYKHQLYNKKKLINKTRDLRKIGFWRLVLPKKIKAFCLRGAYYIFFL